MELTKRKQNLIPGPQTFESMVAFLTNPKAVKKYLAQLAAATEENRKSAEKLQQAVAQIVEAEKIVQAGKEAQEDRGRAHRELEEAQEVATNLKLEATTEAKQTLAGVRREIAKTETDLADRTEALSALDHELAQRQHKVDDETQAAADLMTKAQDVHSLAITLRDEVEARARRIEEAVQN